MLTDTREGIAPEDVLKMPGLFCAMQVEDEETDLELAICRPIMQEHHGHNRGQQHTLRTCFVRKER
jgi:hypothetical protein